MQTKKEAIDRRVDAELDFFTGLALDIARNPEVGEAEFRTSALLVDTLRERGFAVAYPYAGFPTAFCGVRRFGEGPVVAFPAEYDALPEIGHACGHNLNGVMSLLGGIALAEAMADGVGGEIRIIGTPAEETNGAKVRMADEGVFDDVDFAMMVHAAAGKTHPLYRALAIVPLQFDFRGRAAHAAAAPWEGANALNGLQLLFHALDMLRQHVRPETRIHGIVTHGGDAENVVPDFAQGSFYFRSPSRNDLDGVLQKAYDCARGAALATGTDVEWRFHQTVFHEVLPNEAAERAMMGVLDELGVSYAREPYLGGSTDIGNVSWKCPTMHLGLAFTDEEIPAHTREFAALAADESRVRPGIARGARALARMGLAVFCDEEVRGRMRADFERAKTA